MAMIVFLSFTPLSRLFQLMSLAMKEPPGTYAHKQTCALIGQTRQSGDDQMIKCWDQIQHSQPRGPMTMILSTECSCSRGCLTMSNPPPPNTHTHTHTVTHTQPRFQLPGMRVGGGRGHAYK